MENRKEENMEISDGILMAFLLGELETEERKQVENWLLESNTNMTYFKKLEKTWELSRNDSQKFDSNKAWDAVLTQIQPTQETQVIHIKSKRKLVWGIAASILILIGSFVIFGDFSNGSEMISHTSEYKGVVDELSDGSIVTLNSNTRIDYLKNFPSEERRISLAGEAFFEIKRDEQRPFIVDLADNSYVKVLGTAFNIVANDSDSIISVYVASGKVEFGANGNKLILEPGEIGNFNRQTGDLWKAIDQKQEAEILFWKNGEITFDNKPLREVIGVLNAIFDEEVILSCKSAEELLIRTKVETQQTIETTLEIIQSTHNLKMTKKILDGKTVYYLSC